MYIILYYKTDYVTPISRLLSVSWNVYQNCQNYKIIEYTNILFTTELIHYLDIHVSHIQRNPDESNSRGIKNQVIKNLEL